jgi:hypothetical protein
VQLTSIRILRGSVREGVCIAAGVTAEGGCEWRKENGVCGGAECVVGEGAESVGGRLEARWKASFARRLRSRRQVALNQLLKSVSLSLSMPDSAILSWVVGFNPWRNKY